MTMLLTMDQVLTHTDKLPALPQIVFRILKDLADESANVESLAEHIVSDPAVVARLLAAANSASASPGQRVTSVRQAMIMLGVARVRSIVTTTAIIERYSMLTSFDSQRLWRHSLGVAICAQHVAQHAGLNADIAYIAGLLHDIGQLLLYAIDPHRYGEVMALRKADDIEICEAELRLFGVEHSAVGGELARVWNLPNEVADAIIGHQATDDHPPQTEMGDAVHIAEVLSHALELGSDPCTSEDDRPRVPALTEIACARMGIEWHEFAKEFPLIEARFDGARLTLGL
jgi:putative nucleotidyltransferase with HDIG domain